MLIHRNSSQTANNTDQNNTSSSVSTPQPQPKWQRRLGALTRKIAIPLNSLATGRGCESFVPLSMEDECAKAARILRSFSHHYPTSDGNNTSTPQTSHIINIPPSSISSATGILIFTTGRVGFSRLSGSTGSGILITRREPDQDEPQDGANSNDTLNLNPAWNYPLAIQTHGIGLGPLALGFDVSDRVYLIRERESLERMLNKGQFVVGPEVVLAVGKWGGGAGLTFSGSFKEVKEGVNKGREGLVGLMGHGRRDERGRERGRECCEHCQHERENENENQQAKNMMDEGATEKSWGPVGVVDEKSALLVDVEAGHQTRTQGVQAPASSPPAPASTQERTTAAAKKASHPPIHCYMRSHGLYAGLQAEGTVFSERSETNAEFYSRAGAFDEEIVWRNAPGVMAVEEVWAALKELEFGLQG